MPIVKFVGPKWIGNCSKCGIKYISEFKSPWCGQCKPNKKFCETGCHFGEYHWSSEEFTWCENKRIEYLVKKTGVEW